MRFLQNADEKSRCHDRNVPERPSRLSESRHCDGVETQIAGLAMQAARKIVDEETRKQGNQAIYDQFLERRR